MTKRDWRPVEGMEGLQVELDISRPGGPVRHRWLPDGAWHDGYPSPDNATRPSITVSSTGLKGEAARRLIDQIDAKVDAARKSR